MDILRAILLSLESMIEDPELQVNGFVLVIDWSNFTFKQASKLTPSMLRLAIEGLQVGRGLTFDLPQEPPRRSRRPTSVLSSGRNDDVPVTGRFFRGCEGRPC